MKVGAVFSAKDPEIFWNAFRFANLCLEKMDDVFNSGLRRGRLAGKRIPPDTGWKTSSNPLR